MNSRNISQAWLLFLDLQKGVMPSPAVSCWWGDSHWNIVYHWHYKGLPLKINSCFPPRSRTRLGLDENIYKLFLSLAGWLGPGLALSLYSTLITRLLTLTLTRNTFKPDIACHLVLVLGQYTHISLRWAETAGQEKILQDRTGLPCSAQSVLGADKLGRKNISPLFPTPQSEERKVTVTDEE